MTVVQWPMEVRARWSSLMKAWYWMVWKAEMTKGLCPTSGKCSLNIYMLSMRWGEWQTWVYHHYFKTMAFIYRNICYNCIDSTCCFTKKKKRETLSIYALQDIQFKDQMIVSNLTSGKYRFQLTVTDTIGQSDSTDVKVLVLTPEQSEREYLVWKKMLFEHTGI